MHDHHSHLHIHDHSHAVELTHINRAFVAGIVLNSVFVVIEVIAGFSTNSLALLTDAGHNLGDVAGLALSLIAFRLTKLKADKRFTYGYSKSTVLVTIINAVVLLIAVGGIGFEAIQRLFHPQPTGGKIMALVALAGIFINSVSALLFLRDKDKDLNIKGAYIHLAADALVSLGVVIAGVIIYFTHIYWLDSAVSLLIIVVILAGTWRLLADSLRLSLDAVPREIDTDSVKEKVLSLKGIRGIHHVHIWALSTRINALTAHVVIDEDLSSAAEQSLKESIKHELLHLNIQHATLETERGGMHCEEEEHE